MRSRQPNSGRKAYKGCCDICGVPSSPRWYRKYVPGKVICRSCYGKERLKNTDVAQTRRKQNRNWSRTYKGAVKAAQAKDMPIQMSEVEWIEKTKECFYCGKDLALNSGTKLDRVVNDQGYTPENTVGCCRQCNVAKNNYTLDNFKDWISTVYNRIIKNEV